MGSLQDLLRRPDLWRGGAGAAPREGCLPSGFPALDPELPGGGWPRGAMTELLAGGEGFGELQLVLPALAALTAKGGRVAWLAPPHLPYAPALAAAGIDLTRLVVLRAPGRRDALWAAEQVLRSASCRALLAWPRDPRYEELRRLAVAAEAGQACVFLFRPPSAARDPSPASLRLVLEPGAGGLEIRFLKRRGPPRAAPLSIPVTTLLPRASHAVDRPGFPLSSARHARAPGRVDLPVHA